MYILFYLLPLFIAGTFFTNKIAIVLNGCWIFGGIIIVAAVAGYLSKGITIWEPAIAGAGLILILFVAITIYFHVHFKPTIDLFGEIVGILIPTICVFLLSLFGAWLGERAQKLWQTKTPEST
jgi:hypothetical protein